MSNNQSRVLGLDPGLARCGWGVITRHHLVPKLLGAGCITTSARLPNEQRLRQLYEDLQDVFRKFRPDSLAIEKLFFSRNVSTAMIVGQARGVALLLAAQADVPVREFTPTTVKQSVAGYGRADKRQVQTMVRTLLRLATTPKSDDAADAIAVALCGLHQVRSN